MSGLESLRKQSWIRGLDTPAPGENLVPNQQAALFSPPPSPVPGQPEATIPSLEAAPSQEERRCYETSLLPAPIAFHP